MVWIASTLRVPATAQKKDQGGRMKKILMFGCVAFGCVLMQHFLVFAEGPKVIHVVYEEWAGFTNEDMTGVYWDVLKAVYEPVGIQVKAEAMPWKRAEHTVLWKEADAIVGDYYYQEKAGKDFLYPTWHISVEDPIAAVFKKGAIPDWEQQGLQSLAGKTVGWIRGYDFDTKDWFDVAVKKNEVNTILQGLKMLAAGRFEVFIDYRSTIKPEGEKAGIDLEQDYEMKTIKLGDKLFLKFANTERSKQLITIFDERMSKLVTSGEIKQIYTKWGYGEEKFGKK